MIAMNANILQVTTTITQVNSITETPPVITTVSTTTATQTLVVAQSTYYAACGPSNLVSTVNGQNIVTTGGTTDGYVYTSDTTAYDCCASCISNPLCEVTVFNDGFQTGSQCILAVAAGCSSEGQYSALAYVNNAYLYIPYTIANGNCGFFTDSAQL